VAGTVHPIPTQYAGIRFRSRLEARWAVFFDTLGIPWTYEPEAYGDGHKGYTPDFWLPDQDCFWEVKGGEEAIDHDKIAMVSEYTGKTVYVTFGDIGVTQGIGFADVPCDDCRSRQCNISAYMFNARGPSADWLYLWCQCPVCGQLGLEFEARAQRLSCGCLGGDGGRRKQTPHTPDLHRAYSAARSTRFWNPLKPQSRLPPGT
jgi:hypothetical protein